MLCVTDACIWLWLYNAHENIINKSNIVCVTELLTTVAVSVAEPVCIIVLYYYTHLCCNDSVILSFALALISMKGNSSIQQIFGDCDVNEIFRNTLGRKNLFGKRMQWLSCIFEGAAGVSSMEDDSDVQEEELSLEYLSFY